METLTLVGLILLIVGVVLIPFTCFTSLFISLIGIILIVVGESEKSTPQPMVPPMMGPYPPQNYPCPVCGFTLSFVPQYNRWYCNYCRTYR